MRHKLPLMLSSLALAIAIGLGAGYLLSPTAQVASPEPNAPAPKAITANVPIPAHPATTPEAAEDALVPAPPWNGPEKEAALRRIERLSATEAEYLCFTLELIPRDEVFDKVNAKGRLTRYINSLSDAADLRDFNKAIRQMAMR